MGFCCNFAMIPPSRRSTPCWRAHALEGPLADCQWSPTVPVLTASKCQQVPAQRCYFFCLCVKDPGSCAQIARTHPSICLETDATARAADTVSRTIPFRPSRRIRQSYPDRYLTLHPEVTPLAQPTPPSTSGKLSRYLLRSHLHGIAPLAPRAPRAPQPRHHQTSTYLLALSGPQLPFSSPFTFTFTFTFTSLPAFTSDRLQSFVQLVIPPANNAIIFPATKTSTLSGAGICSVPITLPTCARWCHGPRS